VIVLIRKSMHYKMTKPLIYVIIKYHKGLNNKT